MRLAGALILLCALALAVPSAAVVRHVPADHEHIQEAITACSQGDTVLVAPGTYAEAIDFLGKEILVTSRFILSADTTDVWQTVIDASAIPDASVARFATGETPACRFSGFTLTGGSARVGSGIYCQQSSPTLDHLRIVDNTARNEGGGIYTFMGAPLVRACWISGNEAGYTGGGIWAQFSTIVIEGNQIHWNRAGACGAGIFCEHSSPRIIDNRITGNVVDGPSEYFGGGIGSRNCDPVITGNTIIGNDGGQYGGGIFY